MLWMGHQGVIVVISNIQEITKEIIANTNSHISQNYVRWCAEGCPHNCDGSIFEKQIGELAEKTQIRGKKNGAKE
jgi:hypothetical protein